MSFQVLRGAIFNFVGGLEDRMFNGLNEIEEAFTGFIETTTTIITTGLITFIGLIFESMNSVGGIGFNLFRAGLVIVLGGPDVEEDTRLANMMGNFGFAPENIDEVEAAMTEAGEFNYGDFDTDPWANGKFPGANDDIGDWPLPTSRLPGGEPLKEGN